MFFVYYKIYQAFAKHRARQIYRQKVIRKHIQSTILHEISHVLPTSDEFGKDQDENEDNVDENSSESSGKYFNNRIIKLDNNNDDDEEIDDEHDEEDESNSTPESSENKISKFKAEFSKNSIKKAKKVANSVVIIPRQNSSISDSDGNDCFVGFSEVENIKLHKSVLKQQKNSVKGQRLDEKDVEINKCLVTLFRVPVNRIASLPNNQSEAEKKDCAGETNIPPNDCLTHCGRSDTNAMNNNVKTNNYSKSVSNISCKKKKQHMQRKKKIYQKSLLKKPKAISAAKERRGVKVLGIILGCFTICWTPFFVMYVVVQFCSKCLINPHIEMFITWLGYSNSAMNPIIYTVFNRDYQIALKQLFTSAVNQNTSKKNQFFALGTSTPVAR